MEDKILLWVVFNIVVGGLLFLDLYVFHRHAHVVSIREAAVWSMLWISLALLFNGGIYFYMGSERAMEFLTGYIIEKSLSVDNMFVFVMIFSYFNIPPLYQPRILHWGILGALVMRLLLIFAGVALIHAFHWVVYPFGAFLIVIGAKMALMGEQKIEPAKNPVLRLFKKFMPVTDRFEGQSFFVKNGQSWYATPLFAALLVVEASDLIFAIDSIPAILAITTDLFIVYTSNIFAILGLRALYFLLARIIVLFRFLKLGVSVVLCFVGTKMILMDVYPISVGVSLGVVVTVLAVSVLASVILKGQKTTVPR